MKVTCNKYYQSRFPKTAEAQNPPAEKACDGEKKDSSSIFTQTLDFVSTGAKTLARETILAGKNDPALAFRAAATTLTSTGPLLTGVGTAIKVGFEASMPVAMRGALLAGNAYRAYNTYQDPSSSKIEKTIDVAVVVNDTIGLAGGIAMLACGGPVAVAGAGILGFSYAVDALTHAYRGMNHVGERVSIWAAAPEEQAKAASAPEDSEKSAA